MTLRGGAVRGWHVAGAIVVAVILGVLPTAGADRSGSVPRVELERVITGLPRAGGLSGFVSRIAGRKQETVFVRPYGVAWSGEDLIVADPDAKKVFRISSRDRIDSSAEGLFESPVGLAVCGDRILVTDSVRGAVARLDERLALEAWVVEDLDRPTGIACLTDGKIAVVETGAHRVMIITRDGARTTFGRRGAGAGEFNFPVPLAASGESLYVGDTLNFRIQRFDDLGRPLDQFGQLGDEPGSMPRIKGMAIDSRGHVWVTDALLGQVAAYGPGGSLLLTLGGPGERVGEFAIPAGISIRGDRIAIADSLNRRIQVFRLVGGPQGAR